MREKYREFYRLKKSIINKLISIQDGDRMDSYSENMLDNIRNSEAFKQAIEEMQEAEKVINELMAYEIENEVL